MCDFQVNHKRLILIHNVHCIVVLFQLNGIHFGFVGNFHVEML